MNRNDPKSLSPANATNTIRKKSNADDFGVYLTNHVKERMADRSLAMPDILYVLKNGFVYDLGRPATQPKLFKYDVVSSTPNSNRRELKVVAIPGPGNRIKIVTVMWVDE